MKELDKRLPQSFAQEGWAIHIYGGDRRLLCSFYPSHGWSMVAGLALGIILAVSWIDYPQSNQPLKPVAQPLPAPLAVD